jgi:acyl-coenzyme A thioesterase PaaI-like protein
MESEVLENDGAAELRSLTQSTCFACGADNPRGLMMRFDQDSSGAVSALWTPQVFWEGFRGIVHGGLISTVLDEAMSKAVVASGKEALTGEMRVRFRGHVAPAKTYLVRGRVNACRKRLIQTEATLTSDDGTEVAHAWAKFIVLRRRVP